MMQRSLLLFENAIKSKSTHKQYLYYLGKFLKFYHLKDYDSLALLDTGKLQVMVEDYVMDLKKRVNPNSVPTFITPIQTFLEVNDSNLNWKKIHRLYPAKIKSVGRTAYTTDDIKKMLDLEPQRRNRALIHLLASTGMRKGAVCELRIGNLKRIQETVMPFLSMRILQRNTLRSLRQRHQRNLICILEKEKMLVNH